MPIVAIASRSHQRLRPELRHQLGHQAGADDDAGAERQQRRPSAQRAVLQDDLQVEGQEQEHREQPGADQEEHQVGPAAVAVERDPQRQQRVARALLPEHEPDQQHAGRDQEADRAGRAPADVGLAASVNP
jgi:hypothetical protein